MEHLVYYDEPSLQLYDALQPDPVASLTDAVSAQNEFKDPIPWLDLCRFSAKRNSKYVVAGVLLRHGIFALCLVSHWELRRKVVQHELPPIRGFHEHEIGTINNR